MAWSLEYSEKSQKSLKKLGRREADRITRALSDIAMLEDPRSRGHALVGKLRGLWRYRVEDWRVVARIEDQRIVIFVVTIGHRREVYD